MPYALSAPWTAFRGLIELFEQLSHPVGDRLA